MIRAISAFGAATALLLTAAAASAQTRTPSNPNAPIPPADEPLVEDVNVPEPILSFEGGLGVAGFTGGAAALGPAWQGRVTAHFTERWAAEAEYVGGVHERQDNNDTMVTTQVAAAGRYNLLRARQLPLQPFVTAGIGYAGFSGDDGDMSAIVVPLGVGADRMLTRNIRFGARLNFRPVFGEDLSTAQDRLEDESGPGGDTWLLIANIGGAF
jgi:hypothetical protein